MNVDYLFRRFTRKLRSLPDFIIVGAQKAGTSSLAHNLALHPDIRLSSEKELHFFQQQANSSLDKYRHYFPLKISKRLKPRLLSGEATPDYMIYPQVAHSIKKQIPDAKIIVILRNPVDRAFSHYKHNLMMKREWLSFEDALKYEEIRIGKSYIDIYDSKADAIKNYSNYAYQEKGMYLEQLQWIYKAFSKDRVLVLSFEDLQNKPQETYESVLHFLGAKKFSPSNFLVKNQSKLSTAMNDKTRELLAQHYSAHNRELFQLIGTEFQWP